MLEIDRKNFEHEIEDLDEKGVVTIYGNAFDNKDADGDISVKGSFTKTISDNFSRIKHFLNHDGRLLVGIPLEIKEDNYGLLIRSKLNLNKEIGRDAYEDYKLYKENNRSLEHSIGFKVLRRDTKDKSRILEYKLWEYSTLTAWGANERSTLVDIKSFKNADEVILKIKELTDMYNRSYSDGRLTEIEKQLKALSLNAPLDDSTHDDKPQVIDALKEANLLLELKSII